MSCELLTEIDLCYEDAVAGPSVSVGRPDFGNVRCHILLIKQMITLEDNVVGVIQFYVSFYFLCRPVHNNITQLKSTLDTRRQGLEETILLSTNSIH